MTIDECDSEGNFQLRKAAQQDAHPVSSVRLVDDPDRHCEHWGEARLTGCSLGRRSMHIQKHTCAGCGYPAAKIRKCRF